MLGRSGEGGGGGRRPVVVRPGRLGRMASSEGEHHHQQQPQSSSTSSGTTNQSTLSSMETVELDGQQLDEDEEQAAQKAEVWGRLFPVTQHFHLVDLRKMEYTFGRGDECDYSFNIEALRKHASFLAYSKVHFKITREYNRTGWNTILEDISSNGTFINGAKIGKNKKQVLMNNDEISLAIKKNKVFVYMDPSANDDQYPKQVLDRFIISRVLGRGSCGEVRLAFEKGTCNKYAIKVIAKKTFSVGGKTSVNMSAEVMNEAKVLKALKHPCIIEVDVVIDTPETLFIVLEHVEGGELFDRVVNSGQLDEPIAKLFFYQMVCAVKYLHDEGITHRDLKPENVLLATDGEETLIKVTDFGLSKFIDSNSLMKTFCGTPNYLAPEILRSAGCGSYTQAIDCWSLGVILFICLGGYPPFSDDYKEKSLNEQIIKGCYTFPKSCWGKVSEEAIDLVRKLLNVDPEKRLTLSDALKHPWLLDDKMLQKSHSLMFAQRNGSFDGDVTTPSPRRPVLKRQREESNDTEDGDVSCDSFDRPTKQAAKDGGDGPNHSTSAT